MKLPTGISYEEFISYVEKYYKSIGNMKYGQVYMNILSSVKPILADTIKGSIHDPSSKELVPDTTHKLVSSKW